MDSNRVCPNCGFELPPITTRKLCPVCRSEVPLVNYKGTCTKCGKYSDNIEKYKRMCPECISERNRAYYMRKLNAADKQYNEWLDKISKLPYKPLTEEQWLNACRYFDGCALCGNEIIDARRMFIKPKVGGKYAAWNVIPCCEECTTKMHSSLSTHPFRHLYAYLSKNSNAAKMDKRLERVIQYLKAQMEEANG